uniref:Uncharacterized protein n=1 Tax=Arundo donax TaxID=35708 RepID=A0A0A9BPV9_ARUDO
MAAAASDWGSSV